MTKPMYCPMAFANSGLMRANYSKYRECWRTEGQMMECTPDCAWAISDGAEYWCGMLSSQMWPLNTRPLNENDNE